MGTFFFNNNSFSKIQFDVLLEKLCKKKYSFVSFIMGPGLSDVLNNKPGLRYNISDSLIYVSDFDNRGGAARVQMSTLKLETSLYSKIILFLVGLFLT